MNYKINCLKKIKIKKPYLLIFIFIYFFIFISASPIEYYNNGVKAFNEKDYIKAIEYFLKALELNKNYYNAIFYLGLSYFNLKNYNLSLDYFLKAEELVSTDYLLIYHIALNYRYLNNFEKAFQYINKVKKLKPTYLESYYLEAEIYLKQGYLPQALNIYQNILKDYPNDWKTYLLLYKYYYSLGSKDTAINYLQKSINLSPYQEEIYEELIYFFWERGDFQNANFYLQTLYKLNPNNEIAMYFEGKLTKYNGNIERSEEIYETLIKMDPQNLNYIWPLIDIYISKKEYDKAIMLIQQSLKYFKGDELLSSILREILIQNRELNISLRSEVAKDIFKWGQFFYKNGYVNQGEYFVKLATLLEPSNIDYRAFYLNILKTKNLIFEQMEQYILIEAYGNDSFKKNKEILEKYIKNTLESKYNLLANKEIFNSTKINLGIFLYIEDDLNYDEFQLKYLQKFIYDVLSLYAKNFNVILVDKKFNTLESISKYSTKNNIDLFLVYNAYNIVNDIDIKLSVYNSANLQKMFEKRIYYKSEFALLDTIYYFFELINPLIPLRAEIIKVEGNEAIVNIGYENGVKVNDEIIILDSKNLKLKDKEFDLFFKDNEIQANGKVIEVSQKVCRIKFEKISIYSKIINGYYVILKKNK
jgi:hypothetical protein